MFINLLNYYCSILDLVSVGGCGGAESIEFLRNESVSFNIEVPIIFKATSVSAMSSSSSISSKSGISLIIAE